MATLVQQDPSWIRQAPVQIHRSISIDATAAEIWTVLADTDAWAEWFPGMRACSGPGGLDSERFVHQDQFKVTERITAWEPNKQWAMTVVAINVPVLKSMAEEIQLSPTSSPASGPTTLDFRIGVEMASWAKIAKRPLIAKTTKSLERGHQNLAQRVKDNQSSAPRT